MHACMHARVSKPIYSYIALLIMDNKIFKYIHAYMHACTLYSYTLAHIYSVLDCIITV